MRDTSYTAFEKKAEMADEVYVNVPVKVPAVGKCFL